ncbi:MAG: glycosyltransferase family 4 protein [Leptospiraceae bacterium]|nr:glycosyltransferase family 4 protein [Leptospiraceae bacterium]MDW7975864.1 glycosyltransferase family 4 protein [Leptospiraceae bacterium]
MKPYVVFITDFFGPYPGGIESFHLGLVKFWPDEYIITFFLDSYPEPKKNADYEDYLSKTIYHHIIPNRSFKKKNHIKEIVIQLEKLKKEIPIKHILIGNLYSNIKYLYPFIQGLGIPYSIILHPVDLEKSPFFHFGLNRFLRESKYIFTYTHYFYELALINGFPREKLILIPLGLFARWEHTKDHPVNENFKTILKKQKDQFKILTVGPLVKKKHIHRGVFVLEHLIKLIQKENIHWFIAGSGEEFYFLKELIHSHNLEDYITLLGFLSDKELGMMYFHSDVYFHPGGDGRDPFSGFSITLLEAGYSSLPVIAGNGAAIHELVQNNVTGYIVSYDDFELLSYKIWELYKDSKLRKKMGRNAEQKVQKEFYIQRSIHNIYERIM